MKQIKTMMSSAKNGKSAKTALFVTSGSQKGEVNLQWDSVKNARQYIIQVSANGGSSWKHVDIISEPHYTISGLTGGRTYSFRIASVLDYGQDNWSSPVEKRIK